MGALTASQYVCITEHKDSSLYRSKSQLSTKHRRSSDCSAEARLLGNTVGKSVLAPTMSNIEVW